MGIEKILPTPEQEAEAEGFLSEAQKEASESRLSHINYATESGFGRDPEELLELVKNSNLTLERFNHRGVSIDVIKGKIKGHFIEVRREDSLRDVGKDIFSGFVEDDPLTQDEAEKIYKKYFDVAAMHENDRETTEKSIKERDEKLSIEKSRAAALADIL